MRIELNEFTVREVVDGYEGDGHDGVVGYGKPKHVRIVIRRTRR